MQDIFYYIQTNAVCIVILMYLFYYIRKRSGNATTEARLFNALILITVVYCISDFFTWAADGKSFFMSRFIVYLSDMLYIMYIPVMSYLWDDYLLCRIEHVRAHNNTVGRVHLVITTVLTLLTLSTPFTGLAFTVDASNCYHRGIIAYVSPMIAGLFITYMTVNYYRKATKTGGVINRDNFRMVIQFFIPIVVSFAFQMFLYGTSIIQVGITISLLVVFISNQETQISCDELTGLNNRHEFNKYMERMYDIELINNVCVCLIDADNFKKINDTYGHLEGDKALKNITEVIKKACNKDKDTHWFIARFGGDEFVTVGMVYSEDDVIRLQHNMQEEIDKINASGKLPYTLGLSIGYSIGRLDSQEDTDKLLGEADDAMYQNKMRKKAKAGEQR